MSTSVKHFVSYSMILRASDSCLMLDYERVINFRIIIIIIMLENIGINITFRNNFSTICRKMNNSNTDSYIIKSRTTVCIMLMLSPGHAEWHRDMCTAGWSVGISPVALWVDTVLRLPVKHNMSFCYKAWCNPTVNSHYVALQSQHVNMSIIPSILRQVRNDRVVKSA